MNNYWLPSAFALALMVVVVVFSVKLALPAW
jgi:hypothetical protein